MNSQSPTGAAGVMDLKVEGMTCASCVAHVERALAKVDGVTGVSVNLATERAQVQIAKPVAVEDLIQKVAQAGYNAELIRDGDQGDLSVKHEHERLTLVRQFRWSLIATLPVFALEMGAHLVPVFHHWLVANLGNWNWVVQALLTSFVLFGPGRVFYQKGLPALIRLAPDMNSLVAIGSLAAWGYSLVATFLPGLLPPGTVNVYWGVWRGSAKSCVSPL